MKILIVEDEKELAVSMKKYLETEGYLCEVANDYEKASEKAAMYKYDCVIVDITIPKGSGLDVVKELKDRRSEAGIIIVSARNSVDDKIKGLELGSDDYLTKPFHLSELNARVKAIIRRKNFDGTNEMVMNEIKIDLNSHRVYVARSSSAKATEEREEVVLTQKEYDLLLYFISNKNKVVTKNSIAEHLWGDDSDQADSYDFIYTHIKNLRKKLVDKGCVDYITTIYGIGYNFKA